MSGMLQMSDVGIVVRLPEQVRDAFLDRDYEIHPQFADCENELPLRAERPRGTAHGPRHVRSTDRIASAQPRSPQSTNRKRATCPPPGAAIGLVDSTQKALLGDERKARPPGRSHSTSCRPGNRHW